MKPHFWKTGLVMLSAALAATGFFVLMVYGPFPMPVRDVVVEGQTHTVNEKDLLRLSGVKIGDDLWKMNLGTIREQILRYPWIREVHLLKRLPSRLYIRVEEHEPIALLHAGGLYFVSREGVIFKKKAAGDPSDYPLFTGLSEDIMQKKPELARETLLRMIRLQNAYLKTRVGQRYGLAEIHTDAEGELSLQTLRPAFRIRYGSVDLATLDDASWRLDQVLERLEAQQKKPKFVDLNLKDKVVVKLLN